MEYERREKAEKDRGETFSFSQFPQNRSRVRRVPRTHAQYIYFVKSMDIGMCSELGMVLIETDHTALYYTKLNHL